MCLALIHNLQFIMVLIQVRLPSTLLSVSFRKNTSLQLGFKLVTSLKVLTDTILSSEYLAHLLLLVKLLTISITRVVVATNGPDTYTCFQYAGTEYGNPNGGLDWTTGSADNGNGGLGGLPAKVGFNLGDGVRFYAHPDSNTDRIRSIDGIGKILFH